MNKAYLIGAAILLVAFAGIGALYQFYVKKVIDGYQEKQTERRQIEKRLKQLETTFYRTKPDVILQAWHEDTQPWADAIAERTAFFNLGEIPQAPEVPEERIPKFFYRDTFKKMKDDFDDYIFENQVGVDFDFTFGAPDENSLSGTSPSKEQVEEWLNLYLRGAHRVRFMVDAGPSSIIEMAVWPKRTVMDGRLGDIEMISTGYHVSMSLETLIDFLENLKMSERYITVNSLMITNNNLRDSDNELQVKMVVSQAEFKEIDTSATLTGLGLGQDGQPDTEISDKLKRMIEARNRGRPVRKAPSWWQKFRKTWLPF